MPKVSIIIPFNNVENYIEECLKSVLSQTLSDIEVIMINDASTDSSRDIVQKYMAQDERIKLLEVSERKGQGYARNRGIEIAQGEYIGFVDSDDFVEKDMFELLYNSAKANDTDISMCQVREYDDINENYITSDYYSLTTLSSFGDNIFSAEDTKNQILDINVALWNKVYKREYLQNIGEKFPEGFIYEDLPFFFGTYLPAKRIQIVWRNLYSYRVNRKNSTMQQFNNKILDRLPMVSLTYEKLKKVPFLADSKQKIQAWIINDLFHRYTLLKESYHKEFFFLMKKVFESLEIENIEDDFWKKVYHFQGYLLVMNNSFEDFNQKVFNEYLDIHKLEDRLRSEMLNNEEVDRRFNLVYSDLNKVYKYSEDIVNSLENKTEISIKEKIEEVNENINQNKLETSENISNEIVRVNQETDDKLSKVYDEITHNYKYTEQLVASSEEKANKNLAELTSNINEQVSNIKNELDVNVVDLTNTTDEKISQVYSEITKNYEYTNQINEDNKSAIFDINQKLTSEIQDVNNKLDEKINSEIKAINNEIEENNNKLSEKIDNQTIKLINETDDKLSKVYEEITHNYKYTEELVNNSNNKIEELKPKIDDINKKIEENKTEIKNNITSQTEYITKSTDSKISQVYEEITRNYNYTNKLSNDLKHEVYYLNSSSKDEVERLRNNINNQLQEKYKDLYRDIKDLSFMQHDNFIELSKEKEFLKQQNSKILEELANTQRNHEAQINTYKQNLVSKMKDFEGLLKHTSSEINKFIDELQIKIETENQNTNAVINNLKAEFEEKFKQQEQKYNKELQNMQNQMLKMQAELREEMKSPIKKLIEKYKNKQE